MSNIEKERIIESNEKTELSFEGQEYRVEKKHDPWEIKKVLNRIRDKYRLVFKDAYTKNVSGHTKIEKKEEELDSLEKDLKKDLSIIENQATYNGIDYSRAQLEKFAEAYKRGGKTEIDTFGPYARDYDMRTGEIWRDKIYKPDKTGLAIGRKLRKRLKDSKVICLYDEFNTDLSGDMDEETGKPIYGNSKVIELAPEVKENFRNETEALMREEGTLNKDDIENINYKLISESSKQKDAEELVKVLDEKGMIVERNGEIFFSNPDAENPAYMEILLKKKNGHWMCPALDASSFLDEENSKINHLVILPNSYKKQQDQVWEILRALNINPDNYHNIFFDENMDPEEAAELIDKEIASYF